MSDKPRKSEKDKQPSLQEMVAAAMNEQGFLFAQAVQEHVQFHPPVEPKFQGVWHYVEREYPVTAADGTQTRIDLLFRASTGVYACIECKRADPLYKRWIFFNEDLSGNRGTLYFEAIQFQARPPEGAQSMGLKANANHAIRSTPGATECPVFNSYLEIAVDRNKKAGHTETVETAFLQVMKGHTGLMTKLLTFSKDMFFCSIPIVVTTAEIFRVKFGIEKVPLKTGKVDSQNIIVEPIAFCAVNYHPNDELALKSQYATTTRTTIQEDLRYWQRRTIFVVQSEKILEFMGWLAVNAPS